MNQMDIFAIQNLEKTLTEKYPAGIPRHQIGKATGNLLHPRTVANLDSLGKGINGRFRCGRAVVYPVKEVVQFIQARTAAVEA
jgi:hypothetical protein